MTKLLDKAIEELGRCLKPTRTPSPCCCCKLLTRETIPSRSTPRPAPLSTKDWSRRGAETSHRTKRSPRFGGAMACEAAIHAAGAGRYRAYFYLYRCAQPGGSRERKTRFETSNRDNRRSSRQRPGLWLERRKTTTGKPISLHRLLDRRARRNLDPPYSPCVATETGIRRAGSSASPAKAAAARANGAKSGRSRKGAAG